LAINFSSQFLRIINFDLGLTDLPISPFFTNESFFLQVPVERRTLPTDLPGPSRRRPFTKRHSPSAEAYSSGGSSGGGTGSVATGTGSGMQTSCSLPETPVFARGSDIPRTPQHAGNPTQSRRQPGWYAPTTATG